VAFEVATPAAIFSHPDTGSALVAMFEAVARIKSHI